ncbi:hypothetical protein V5799_000125 [Amblyomma americanum]|uniref:Rac GTPase-activating protein 1 n=1 Tax=Amblyomma americanum TaxID=6943 RepID=A0AAQ4D3Y2_AMBAM
MSSAGTGVPRLSLLAQLDDFCRQICVDDDEETLRTFLEFVRNQEVCRQRWEAAERCVTRLAEENRSLALANSELQEKLQYTRAVFEKEVERRRISEARAEALQLKLDQVRQCIFSRKFRRREFQMVQVLKSIFGNCSGGLASTAADKSTTADKSVQCALSSPNSGPSLLSGDCGIASRKASRGEDGAQSWWMAQSLPGTPATNTGTGHLPCARPVPAERSSLLSVSAGAGPAGPVPIGNAPNGLGFAGMASAGVPSHGLCMDESVPTGAGPAGPVPIGNAPNGLGFAGTASAGIVSHGLCMDGSVPAGAGPAGRGLAGPVPIGNSPNGLGFAGTASAGIVSHGLCIDGSVPAGAGSVGFCFARPAPAGDVYAGLGLSGPASAGIFSNGLGFAGSVPTTAGFAGPFPMGLGLADTVLAPCSGRGAPVGPGFAGLGSGGASTVGSGSAGPCSAPAKVNFELTSSQKGGGNSFHASNSRVTSSRATSSHATNGRVGKVFATTMTMVAGEPGYVATVASQMEGSGSTLSSQQAEQSIIEPASTVQHSHKPVPKKLEESQVEQESGFVSGLTERPRRQRSTSTPIDMSPPLLPQQSHMFTRCPAVSIETCAACGCRIRFYKASLRCSACRLTCHPDCKNAVPLPCTPGMPLEQARVVGEASAVGGSSKGGSSLSDYTPGRTCLVPPLVVHCIQEVERRCAMEKGPLYGSTVAAEEVDLLLGQLLNGQSLPALDGYSLPVVCGALVTFLASLRETVITKAAWPLLATATEEVNAEKRLPKLLDATVQLPAFNRAALSVLMAHLHRVSTTSLGGDGRSLAELATVFAPLVVGCSESEPSAEVQKRDKPLQELIMHCLLSVPEVYWTHNTAAIGNGAEDRNFQQRPAIDDNFVAGLKEGIRNRLRYVRYL